MMKNGLLYLFLVYFFSRLIRLMILPIFIDEAFYLMLGYQIKEGLESPWIALFHGNCPFFSNYLSILLRLPYIDPLIIGRLSSVIIGFLVILIIYHLGLLISSQKVGFMAGFFYVLSPFSLIYDRLILIEPLVQLLGVTILYLLIKTTSSRYTGRITLFLGLLLGIGFLTKASAFLFLLLVIMIILFSKIKRNKIQKIIIILISSFILFSIVRFHPLYYRVESFNLTFISSLSDLITNPLRNFRPNFTLFIKWVSFYWGLGISCYFLIAVYCVSKSKGFVNIIPIIGIWVISALAIQIFAAKIFYPRYFFFLTAFVCLVAAVGFNYLLKQINNKLFFISLNIFVFLPLIINDYQILKDITKANLPAIEKWQFLESWPAGYGLDQMRNFVRLQTKHKKTEFIAERYNLPYFVLYLYEHKNPNLILTPSLPSINYQNNLDYYSKSDLSDKYIIINQSQELPQNWNVDLVRKFPKVTNKMSILIYKE